MEQGAPTSADSVLMVALLYFMIYKPGGESWREWEMRMKELAERAAKDTTRQR